MTAKVQQPLPPFNNLVKEIIELSNNVVCTRSENPKTRSHILHSLPDGNLTLPLHSLRPSPLQLPPQLLHRHLRPPKLVQQHTLRAPHVPDLRRHPLLQPHRRHHERRSQKQTPLVPAQHEIRGLPPTVHQPVQQNHEQQRTHVPHCVQHPSEPVEPVQLRLDRHPLLEPQRQRLNPRLHQRPILLLQPHRLSPAPRYRPHNLFQNKFPR